jgi:hypothetical protein
MCDIETARYGNRDGAASVKRYSASLTPAASTALYIA